MTTTTKERPIIFTAESVSAILAGRKQMTRRVLKPQPPPACGVIRYPSFDAKNSLSYATEKHFRKGVVFDFSPWRVGGLLWVKETWRPASDNDLWDCVEYRDGTRRKPEDLSENEGFRFSEDCNNPDTPQGNRWRSPIFMPRWASRVTLEITEVRVERLTEISEEDCWAEGVIPESGVGSSIGPRPQFEKLWDSINGRKPGCAWKDSPWCWALSFKRVPQ